MVGTRTQVHADACFYNGCEQHRFSSSGDSRLVMDQDIGAWDTIWRHEHATSMTRGPCSSALRRATASGHP